MAGVWDALGAGIERGVAAYLAGRQAQEQRKLDEEEKARLEREWLLRKMQGEAAMDQATWDRIFREQQAKEVLAAEARQRQAATEAATTAFGREKELLQMQLAAKPGKEPEKTLYDKQGFNGEIALYYVLKNQGLETDTQLDALLNRPDGQMIAEKLVNRLLSTHGWRWPKPKYDLETDLWNFFKARNPRLQSSADRAAANAAQQQLLAQQQTAREAEAAARAQQRAEWQARQAPLPQTAAQMQRATEQPPQMFVNSTPGVANPELVTGVQMPQTLEEMVMGPGRPSASEQQIINQYKNPNTPETVKSMMMNNPDTRRVLDKWKSLL